MAEMSKAIREVLESYGPTLALIPDEELMEFSTILAAFSLDVGDETRRRGLRHTAPPLTPDTPPREWG